MSAGDSTAADQAFVRFIALRHPQSTVRATAGQARYWKALPDQARPADWR